MTNTIDGKNKSTYMQSSSEIPPAPPLMIKRNCSVCGPNRYIAFFRSIDKVIYHFAIAIFSGIITACVLYAAGKRIG